MSKRFMLVVMVVILLGAQAIVTSVLSQSGKQESKSVDTLEGCVCGKSTFVSGGHYDPKFYLTNCKCGSKSCVVSSGIGSTANSFGISCVKSDLF